MFQYPLTKINCIYCFAPSCILLPVFSQTFGLFSESGQETDSFLGASVSRPSLKPTLGQPEQEVKRQ